jgi:CheY-like chemotaxis protein
METEQATSAPSKAGLAVGQRYLLADGTTLYVNDNFQFGVWVEDELNSGTTDRGRIVSGELAREPVTVVDLYDSYPGAIALEVTRRGGDSGRMRAAIRLDLFLRLFHRLPARVLHVEDHPNWLETVREILEEAGYEVTSFDTLPAARKAAAGTEFDYFICDTNVRGDDGSEWASELHNAGKKVMSLATDTRAGVPLLSKGHFDEEGLLTMLRSL